MVIKSVLDRFFALVGIIIFAPLLFFVGILVSLDGRGHVLFRQQRMGRKGKPFGIFKFRTMTDCDLPFNPDNYKQYEGTAKITSVGKILRKYKLDELPQLFNVLLGQMSIVGPRPFPLDYNEKFTEWRQERYSVKPGMTGLAQVEGGTYLSFDSRCYYDVFYARNTTFFTDVRIFFKTFSVVFHGEEKCKREASASEIEALIREKR